MNPSNLKRVPFYILIGLIVVYLSRSSSNQILLFPFWFNAILYFIGLAIAFVLVQKWQLFTSDKPENKNIVRIVNGIFALIVAFVFLCFFRLPINWTIKQQSKKNERTAQTCPITFYSIGLKNQQKKHVTFTFQNKNIRMKVRPTVMAKIKTLSSSQKNIQLQIRKSILGTYVVEDYDVF